MTVIVHTGPVHDGNTFTHNSTRAGRKIKKNSSTLLEIKKNEKEYESDINKKKKIEAFEKQKMTGWSSFISHG